MARVIVDLAAKGGKLGTDGKVALEDLISLGKARGSKLTFDEIFDQIVQPEGIATAEEMDDILLRLGEHGIEVVDDEDQLEEDSREEREARAARQEGAKPGEIGRSGARVSPGCRCDTPSHA
jgi:hypothetical protein